MSPLLRRGPKAPSRHAKPPVLLGVLGALALLVGTYFAFAKRIPFVEGYRVQAVMKSSAGLRKGDPVRIAGVEVGKVADLHPGPDATRIVELEIDDQGRPVHRDATLRVRPRLFLEGGYYVELSPGSPSAPELAEGGTIPLPQTAIPVQFDQILSTLTRPIRDGLRETIAELDRAMDDGGAEALADAAEPLAPALRDTAIVTEAARGTEQHDVSRLVSGAAKATAALGSRRRELASLVTSLAQTSGALASESAGLRATVRELDRVVRETPGSLREIERVLPVVDAFLAEARPGLRRARTVLPGAERLLRELQLASRPQELPGLLGDLGPAVRRLPTTADRLAQLFPLVTPVTDCVRERALPVLNAKVDDGALSTGRPVWKNLADATVGLAGASGSFDANGTWIRYLFTGGEYSVTTGQVPGLGELHGFSEQPVIGSSPRPFPVDYLPPFRPDARCADQQPPDLGARRAGGPATASRRISAKPRRLSARQLRRALAPERLRRSLRAAGLPGRSR